VCFHFSLLFRLLKFGDIVDCDLHLLLVVESRILHLLGICIVLRPQCCLLGPGTFGSLPFVRDRVSHLLVACLCLWSTAHSLHLRKLVLIHIDLTYRYWLLLSSHGILLVHRLVLHLTVFILRERDGILSQTLRLGHLITLYLMYKHPLGGTLLLLLVAHKLSLPCSRSLIILAVHFFNFV
jgi:hypothetical protein